MNYAMSHQGQDVHPPLPSRTGSPVSGLTHEQKTEGVVLTFTSALRRTLYHDKAKRIGPRGRQRSPGRHWDKSWDQARPHESQWESSWNQPNSFGKSREKSSWEFNGKSKGKGQTHPGAISPRIRRKNSPRFQTDRAQTESTQEQKTPPYFDSQKLIEVNDDERVLPTKRGGSEVGKERETRFSLTSCWTRRQRQAEQISHRKQHCFTSLSENSKHPKFRWTRNPT